MRDASQNDALKYQATSQGEATLRRINRYRDMSIDEFKEVIMLDLFDSSVKSMFAALIERFDENPEIQYIIRTKDGEVKVIDGKKAKWRVPLDPKSSRRWLNVLWKYVQIAAIELYGEKNDLISLQSWVLSGEKRAIVVRPEGLDDVI